MTDEALTALKIMRQEGRKFCERQRVRWLRGDLGAAASADMIERQTGYWHRVEDAVDTHYFAAKAIAA